MKFSFLICEKTIFILVFFAILFWHVFSLTRYPMYFPDDGSLGSKIKSMHEEGHSLGDLELVAYQQIPGIEKIFSKTGYYFSILPVMLTGEITLKSVRGINIVFIALICGLVFLIAKKLADWRLGILSIFLLGFSQIFAYGTHIARHDLISATLGLSCLCIFLYNKNEKLILDFITGILLILSISIHPRIIIYIPIIACLYLQRYGLNVITSKNAWSYALGVIISAGLYYLIMVLPFQQQHLALLKMTVGDSRSMPLISLDYRQFLVCLKEIYFILHKESYLFLAIFLELATGLVLLKNKQSTVILAATLFFTAGIMRNFYDFNAIIVLPLLVLGSAMFFYRFFANKILTGLILILIVHYAFFSISRMNQVVHNGCNTELEENSREIRNLVSTNDIILGVDSFWFGFQGYKFYSWVVLNYFRRFYDYSLENAFNRIKPNYMLVDGRFFYFVKNKSGKSDWHDNFLIKSNELDQVLNRYANVIWKKENTCNGDLVLYKFNWQVNAAQNNI